ncbi:succinate--CoA ligase subunit beta [Candidatus Woesearchaeota archaeon CG10_big_fil_rev_8_21_14_0_10_34_8]|nr:MAG: succinate--CoA ligase subunit beta [Candidatus Woesearchaeota archaeon CG10_big_fil_rev_8_21_14_0_10_34_8]
MRLKEYEGKEIFKQYGIDVPKGYVVSSADDVKEDSAVLKAQVLEGGRKKNGLILISDNAKEDIKGLLEKCDEVLVEEKLDIEKELYLSLTIDRFEKCVKLLFCKCGGIDIEDMADNVVKIKIETENDVEACEVSSIAKKLYKIMKETDAELVEINPLVYSNGKYIAADSKIIIDDNALFRHPELVKENKMCYAEERAAVCGFNYVELDGDIAVIGNGAGLVMSTLDVLNYYGGKAADFLDVGGGADVKRMEQAMDVVLTGKPKALLINIFGGITRCDEIAQGIVNYKKSKGIEVPMVVRLIGTNEDEGKKILNDNCIASLDSMEDCVKAVVGVVK